MATCTHLKTLTSTTDGSSFVTTSYTPAGGDLIVVVVLGVGTIDADSTMVDSVGGTYTAITNRNFAGTHRAVTFVRNSLIAQGSPGARTNTFDCTGDDATGCFIEVFAVNPVAEAGAAAIRQSKGNESGANNKPLCVMDAACLPGNPIIVGCARGTNPATLTPPTGWTERSDVGIASPTFGCEVATRDSGFSGTDIEWNPGIAAPTNAHTEVALEIAASHAVTLTPATEADAVVAQNIDKQRTLTPLAEADAVQALNVDKQLTLTPLAEADEVVAQDIDKQVNMTPLEEADAVVAQTIQKLFSLVPLVESDAVVVPSVSKQVTLTPLDEVDETQAITLIRFYNLPPLEEVDQVQALALQKFITLTALAEADQVQAPSLGKQVTLTPLEEADAAVALVLEKEFNIVPLGEVDEVQTITLSRMYNLQPLAETDLVVALTLQKQVSLVPLTELDEVVPLVIFQGQVVTLVPLIEVDTVLGGTVFISIGTYGGNDEPAYSYDPGNDATYGEAVGALGSMR